MGEEPRISLDLSGVPETLLWTLYYRAQEASRPDAILQDPVAVELVGRIDYPFAERLGAAQGRAQWQGLRSRVFDERTREFLAAHAGGTVVALGEGLDTAFWRVDDGQVRWLGVDLTATADLRRRALPSSPRRRQLDVSALDEAWMDEVDTSRGLLLTAQGLLMYLQRDEVHRLITACGRRFPGAEFVFDGVPRWTSWVTTHRKVPAGGSMPAPPMPWAMDGREAAALRELPGVRAVVRLHPPRGRGALQGWILPVVDRLPLVDASVLSIWSARLG